MALAFDSASNENAYISTGVVTATPFTMAAWFYALGVVDRYCLVGLTNEGEYDNWLLCAEGGSDQVFAYVNGTSAGAGTSTTYTANVWHHACGVYTSTTSRAAYLNGGGKGTDVTSAVPGFTMDRTCIGGNRALGGPYDALNGRLAEVGIWNAALTDAEAASLGKGVSPLLIRPASLIWYVPCVVSTKEVVLGTALTTSGTLTVQPHPRVTYPQRRRGNHTVAAVAGGGPGRLIQGGLIRGSLLRGGRLIG